MLQQLRPYCCVVVYLLLMSYGAILGHETICELYCSVAYTAKVMNASMGFGEESDHHHSQDEALLYLAKLQKIQEEIPIDSQENNSQEPQQQLKFLCSLTPDTTVERLCPVPDIAFAPLLPTSFQAINAPPPKMV